MSNNLTAYWTKKWTDDLTEWGVTIPENISTDELKALHMQHKAGKAPSTKPTDMSMVPMDQVAALVQKLVQEQLAQVPQAPAQGNAGITPETLKALMQEVRSEAIGEDGLVPEGYVPPEDYIETQKFFVPFARYYVYGKEVGPVHERLPYNMKFLRFEPKFAYYTKENGVMHHKHIAVLEVSSRKVYEYITGETLDGKKVGTPLPEYGRVIFKDAGAAAASEQTAFAQMVQKHYTLLARKPLHELVKQYQGMGGATSSAWGISDYAWAIASQTAEREMENIHAGAKRAQAERDAARLLLKQEGVAVG